MNKEIFKYDNVIVRNFAFATVIWGLAGMLLGLILAVELFAPSFNINRYLAFGRLRPLHTNAVIFAFVGNGFFMGAYYSLQRLCKARMFSDTLSKLHFWGWQAIILSAVITLPLGITSNKEYAELEWPIDIAITLVWVIFGINLMGTIIKRREKHMYVAIWFYMASFIAVAILHIFNSLEVPVSLTKSYSIYAGVQDALVQWWYGHNAVAFFLTTPYLGLMYYFLPKAANRPVFSYRLSIIHFWALVFLYIWAGPHHLLYSAVPEWAQSLGVVFSIMLIAPSWGGMLNGLLTLRGVWDRVKSDPVLKFLVVAVTCYGMVTLEGPLLSLKSINALAHFTDYIIGHVHLGGLGWNGFLTFGILYWLIPKLYNTKLYSVRLANLHFWVGSFGIIIYVASMYFAGLTQGVMWKTFDAEGFLKYPNFTETVTQILPMYFLRAIGGTLYFVGAVIMAYNLFKTVRLGSFVREVEDSAYPLQEQKSSSSHYWHRWIEAKPMTFFVCTIIAVAIGGLMELVPSILQSFRNPVTPRVAPYTALEIEGRDIYIREGCYHCHSQMIRPFRSEIMRYGEHSKPGDYAYEHPFLWGSRRIGPDLQKIGGKYSDLWHYNHLIQPADVSPGSIMPTYEWLAKDKLDTSYSEKKMKIFKSFGAPYQEKDIKESLNELEKQAKHIAQNLQKEGIQVNWNHEIIALIAYLQKLGKPLDQAGGNHVK